MRLQHVAVMFIIIFIPIILVTSYFISLQVNTIKLEADYDEKLLKSTYDAMTSFELNTANEDLSSVSDSLRSIIEASNNIFFNTLCTNLGVSNASKSYILPYIPVILYTLYDGYYIYSPTNIPEICTDKFGRTIRTSDYGVTYDGYKTVDGKKYGFYKFNNDDINYSIQTPTEPESGTSVNYNDLANDGLEQEYGQILYKNKDGTYSTELHTFTGSDSDKSTYYKRSYILKSYIPYSARYSGINGGIDGNKRYDITINYTLDNFMTVEGTLGDSLGDIYYTKSGYLIKDDLITSIEYAPRPFENFTQINSWTDVSEDVLNTYINDPDNYEVKVKLSDGLEISNRDGYVEVPDDDGVAGHYKPIYWDDAQSAVEYYVDSYIFSKWFYENFNGIKASDLENTQYSVSDIQGSLQSIIGDDKIQTDLYKDMLYDFEEDDDSFPFARENNDPEDGESEFYKHKRNVIKNSITYNLILSMLVYTEESKTVEFNMPVFKDTEWDSILNNVSIVTFMEGLRCGLKYYNNYAIVTSTNNEISVTDNEIYYVPRVIQDIDSNGDEEIDFSIISNLEDDYVFETAHRIDCEDLDLGGVDNFQDSRWLGCISFKSKEIKYDKILEKDGTYTYDHKAYTDYDCIVDSNYEIKNVDGTKEDGNTDVLTYLTENTKDDVSGDDNLKNNLKRKLKAYRIAIAKERNNLYKTTAFPENYGWQVIYQDDEHSTGPNININMQRNGQVIGINEILKTEVTINNISSDSGIYSDNITVTYDCKNNDTKVYDTTQTISTTYSDRRTLEFKQDFDGNEDVKQIRLNTQNGTNFGIESIKVYFK